MNLFKQAGAVAALAATCLAASQATAAEDFKGVTVNVMTFVGPQIAEPLQRRAPEFEKLTGAKVNVLTVPFSDLYQKLLTDWASGTNSVDAAVFAPQWMVDYTKGAFLEDLTQRVAKDAALKEDDVMPFFVDFSQKFNGKTYLVALDGDFQMVYYRTDILQQLGKQPPKTWDDYLDIAKAANGKVFGGDGKPVAGSCISKKRNAQAYWAIISIAGGYLQSKGTAQGAFFDPRNFKALVNNDGFKEALRIYKESTSYGPPNEINLDVGDTRSAFISGHCALTLDWGDVGVLAIDPKQSKVIDKVGAVILPGSRKIVDRDTGKLVPCDKATCPYAIDGVNHAPFAAFGGWSGGINAKAKPKVKDAAYAFLSFMSQPAQSNVDVTIGASGFNPYRRSQFTDMSAWKKAGMSDAAAKSYLGAIQQSLQSPNMIIDLRIPQNQRYEQVVLDTAVARFVAGEIDADATMKAIDSGWSEITDDLGKDTQLRAYKASIGAK
ncbi:extracellular solute-binding protein [Caballeronia sp. NK8]|uniref:ABC transporter substrate-binding protein n=1 Tax=Caballeronia sp. NK8 TaxID=140098 RepID=UPI001BB7A62C|nr:extracellular solute-binding protein [Caballeronia sp. NK8]BCQ25671.1 extracellular solute-binding protein [Caballeronia sp. NK8]